MKSSKPRLLFIHPKRSTFVQRDMNILVEDWRLREWHFKTENKSSLPFRLFIQFLWLLVATPFYSRIVCKFSGYHSLLPAIFGKLWGVKVFIIPAGTDCVSFPSIAYGNFRKKLLAFFTTHSYRLASHIIPMHESMALSEYTYDNGDFPRQGFLQHAGRVDTPYTIVPNGYDTEFWNPPPARHAQSFITVASGADKTYRQALKGIDLILAAAPAFPDCHFLIVGSASVGKGDIPSNVSLRPFASAAELRDLYAGSMFYLQLSMSEGFPNSLCEAMLCRCIPIVSAVASMPDIVGDSGFILQKRRGEMLSVLLQEALDKGEPEMGEKARNRIVGNYSLDIRRQGLRELLR